MELVQLCTTLIQHAHPLFQEHRKELIQFGWSVTEEGSGSVRAQAAAGGGWGWVGGGGGGGGGGG